MMKDSLTAAFILLSGLLLSALPFLPAPAAANPYYTGAAAQPASGQAFSDDFNRTSSTNLGSDWTEADGTWEIVSDTVLEWNEGSFGPNVAIYSGQACDTVDQYVKYTFSASGGGAANSGAIFRYTNASTEFYLGYADDGNDRMSLYHVSQIGGTLTEVAFAAMTFAVGDTIGMTLDGDGTDVVLRGWINPTGLPDSASSWDGDATPDATITTDPADVVDSGSFTGLYGTGTVSGQLDDFFGGDL